MSFNNLSGILIVLENFFSKFQLHVLFGASFVLKFSFLLFTQYFLFSNFGITFLSKENFLYLNMCIVRTLNFLFKVLFILLSRYLFAIILLENPVLTVGRLLFFASLTSSFNSLAWFWAALKLIKAHSLWMKMKKMKNGRDFIVEL